MSEDAGAAGEAMAAASGIAGLGSADDSEVIAATTAASAAVVVATPASEPMGRLALAGLRYPPFRVFFWTSLLYDSGSFVFTAALGWLVLEATGSAASVGLVSFLYSLPFALFMLHAGLLTDRVGARPAFAASLAGSGLATMLLGALVLADHATLPAIALVAFGIGSLAVLGSPGSLAIVNDLVPAPVVPSGISLIFLALSIGRILGGAAGGFMLARIGSGWTTLLAGLSYVVSAIPVWRLPTGRPAHGGGGSGGSTFRPLIDAGRYAAGSPVLSALMVLAALPGMLGMAYSYLLPVAAVEVGLGADGLGVLLACAGVGGLAGSFGAPALMRAVGHGRTILLGLGCIAVGLGSFGLAGSVLLAGPSMALTGLGFVLFPSASLSVVQAVSPTELRGRLTALFSLLYWGLTPIGALLGGVVAGVASARTTFLLAGTVLLACGVATFLWRPVVSRLRIGPDGHLVDA